MSFPIQNTRYKIQDTRLKGFTLIEALVFLFIFSVVSVTFYQTYSIGVRTIIESKNRLGATALANQKMEIIRSIAYSAIGTKHWNGTAWVYGVVAGDILQDEDITVNTTTYRVHTVVQYADDAFDGTLGGSPNDAIPNDYKVVRLTVSWGSMGDGQSVVSYANFSPKGIETPAGGGVFSINILNSEGAGVSGATVRIQNPASSIDMTTTTNSDGNITLVGTPSGTETYQLTISKGGYYGATTYPPYPTTTEYSPTDVHASVVNGVLNQKTMVMDQSSDIRIMSKDAFGTSIPNVSFHVEGGRIMGTDTALKTVYGLKEDSSTDASGERVISDQSYGPYTLTFTDPAQYEFYALSPEGAASDSFSVSPGSTADITGVFLNRAIGSLKVVVTTSDTGNAAIPDATAHLTNSTLGYDATVMTDKRGVAYFPTSSTPLADGTYDLSVSASGFDSDNSSVTIAGALVDESVVLNPD